MRLFDFHVLHSFCGQLRRLSPNRTGPAPFPSGTGPTPCPSGTDPHLSLAEQDPRLAPAKWDLRLARRQFSRVGLAVFLIPVVTALGQLALCCGADAFFPALMESSWGLWILAFVPQYLAAFPLALLVLQKAPAAPPERHPLGFGRGVRFFFLCAFGMGFGLFLSGIATAIASRLLGNTPTNALESYVTGDNLLAQTLFLAILAPLGEEFVFRKQIIDRLRPYGGKAAVVLSGLIFGLIHGNFFQFFYAFFLGLIFGYIYLNTGRLRCTVIAHMVINFIGSVVVPEIAGRIPMEETAPVTLWELLYGGYLAALFLCGCVGLVLLVTRLGSLRFPAGDRELPGPEYLAAACGNVGMLLALLICTVQMVLSLGV